MLTVMARLTEHGLSTFQRGAYRHTLTELGEFISPPYLDDDDLPLPDLTERAEATAALSVQAICEYRLGYDSGIRAVMAGPYWDCQEFIGQALLNYGLSFYLKDHCWLMNANTLKTMGETPVGQAILFEIALELLKSDQLNELGKLAHHLDADREEVIIALQANISREPLSASQLAALRTIENHPVVAEILATKARDRLRINILTNEIILNNVTCARPSKYRVRMEHLVLVLAQLRTGSATSGDLSQEALFEKGLAPGYIRQIMLVIREMLGPDAIDCKQKAYLFAATVKAETDLDGLAARVEASPFKVLQTIASAGQLELTAPFVLRQIDSIVRAAFAHLHELEWQEGMELVTQVSGWVPTLSDVGMISLPAHSAANRMN